MPDYSTIGKSIQRIDGIDKVLGKSQYVADIDLPGALCLKVLRSEVAHALVKKIDVDEAERIPGVVRIFTHADIPGINGYGIIVKDQPVLTDKVRFKGDALALVAAENEEIAKKALKLIKVDLEELPPLYDVWSAMKEDASPIHSQGNVLTVNKVKKGDVEAAFNQAAVIISRSYSTQRVEHCYIETEAGVAYLENGILVIKVSTQNPHYDRRDVARVLGLPLNKVRIIQITTGGGFGGKLDISVQCLLGLAAMKLGQPVRIVYDRQESFVATGKRHPFFIDYTTAADKEGKLLAVKVKIVGDTGAYASYGPATLNRAAVHATGPYEVPNADIEALCVYTNNPFSGAMRGFGTPQMAFACESQMDLIAEVLGISPVEIRRRNILQPGLITATGQKMNNSVGIGKTLEAAWEKALQVMLGLGDERRKKRGHGIANMWFGIGNTANHNPSGAFVDLLDDGTAIVLTGCADIGQGSTTTLAQIAAETLGISIEDVVVMAADTEVTPDAGATSASRQTYISGNAVRLAAENAREQVLAKASEELNVNAKKLSLYQGQIYVDDNLSGMLIKEIITKCRNEGVLTLGHGSFDPLTTKLDPETGQGIPYATYAFATQIAEVEVNTETGIVEVIRIVAAHDVGKAINPQNVEGQIEGGCSMGIGYALTEEVIVKEGEIQNHEMSTYLIPTAMDVPEVYPIIIEEYEESGPYGAKGVGEPALVPTAAAIANAVADALGIRIYELPITPERIIAAIKAAQIEEKRKLD